MDKLYIITRSDLAPGVRAAQLCHGMRQWSAEKPEADKEWFEKSNTLVLLEVADEAELLKLAERASADGVACVSFREPDMNNALTAIAICGEYARKLLSQLPLAFRIPRSSDLRNALGLSQKAA